MSEFANVKNKISFLRASAIFVAAMCCFSLAQADDATVDQTAIDPAALAFFEQKIQPVLVASCYDCHSHAAGESNGALVLDSAAGWKFGGSRGASIVPGNPDASHLLKAMTYEDSDLQMPPDGKLSDEIIADFRKWIADGAVDPRKTDIDMSAKGPSIAEATETHWAYQIPQAPPQPAVEKLEWPRQAIDYLILAKLEARGLSPSAEANRGDLVRRVYFDLIGLPPTKEQLDEAVHSQDEKWYETMVESLLGSSAFGERWARYWMDVARYADTKGYVFQEDRAYPAAFRYRNWLIKAINDDLPYDQFIKLQIAADRLTTDPAAPELDAMGFLTLGRRFLNNTNDIIDDRIDVVSRGLMGMTVACARCHDHKFDPVSTKDYYSMYSIFLNSDEPKDEPAPLRLIDSSERRQAFVLVRGSPGNRGDKVDPRFVSFLSKSDSEAQFKEGSGRLELANSIASPSNPLTSRVMVNRVWLRLTGASLTDSPSDFGLRTEAPVQQDVMDQLAADFVSDNWSVKNLIRQVIYSSTYRQSSVYRDDAAEIDPENSLFWRMNRRRLDFEAFRDAMLAASDQLETQVGGPSVSITDATPTFRRTVYAHIDRQNLPGLFRSFDFSSPDAHSPQRLMTTVPQQGLFVMNSPFVMTLAERMGEKANAISNNDNNADINIGIAWLFEKILLRAATPAELEMAKQIVASEGKADIASSPWSYGYGEVDSEAKSILSFQPLPKFAENRWSGNQGIPDPELGYSSLTADGGHPGNNLTQSVIRRWTAPADGKMSVRGRLKHPKDEGDGVRGSLFVQGKWVKSWTAANKTQRTDVTQVDVNAGDHIDLVVDCITSPNHDSFEWRVSIELSGKVSASANSKNDFGGPPSTPLNGWGQLAQVLLATNEFAFVE